ncbi:NAD(P)H-binding protein [Paenibacillus sp. LHD-38]|uniref:NAD(P)H-binding protein n=1 Tax=Paenibacillus sp. LHD-38 TaxID=3072143 RepID=UPI00280E73DF|nr:NAD(P)H-binding protein [Paenibacillus sp. LHD-38]MDQ8737532.1 NAD(P)H-binding protein [Paenibacillus sp. LHD-38]
MKHDIVLKETGSNTGLSDNETAGCSALLVGATGLIGSALLRQLLRDPLVREVTVLARRPIVVKGLGTTSERMKLRVIVADLDDMDQALDQVTVDAVFCTLGTTIKAAKTREAFRRVDYDYPLMLAHFAERTGASLFSVVTAMGADSSSNIFYSRVKGELQDALARLHIPIVQVFQPSLLLGERTAVRPGEAIGAFVSKGLQFAMIGPLRKYRPIKGTDVALAMIRAAENAVTKDAAAAASKAPAIYYYPSDKIADLAVHTTG